MNGISLSGQTALITGASSGIGMELARLLARDGCGVVLVARRAERLEALAGELRLQDVNVQVMTEDLADRAAPARLVERLTAAGTAIGVLINNAGFGAHGAFADLNRDRQLEMIQLNVVTLTDLTHRLLPAMIADGKGAILNVASTAGFQPGPYMAVYYATKAYVLSLTEALAEELNGTGVSATCLAPGPTATEFATEAGMDDSPLFRLGAMEAAAVARCGYTAMSKGKAIAVPGLTNRIGVASLRATPRFAVRKLIRRLNGI